MPKFPLPPFATFKVTDFHIGGSVSTVLATGAKWVAFGENAQQAASALRSIHDGGFIGTEGDKYRELVNDHMPGHLDITGTAHGGVGEAINRYGQILSETLASMTTLTIKAQGDHGAVQHAVAHYNIAETTAMTTRAQAMAARAAAMAVIMTPAFPAAMAAAVAAESTAATAEANRQAADAHHASMLGVWKGDLTQAQSMKDALGVDVEGIVATIEAQARKRFQENPTGLAAAWADVTAWVNDNAELLGAISDVLQIIGGIMMFIPGLNVLGAVLLGIGVALKGLLALTGNASWGEFAFDLVTSLPGGKIVKVAKMTGVGKTAFRVMDKPLSVVKNAASRTVGKVDEMAKGVFNRVKGGDPVDMATGVLLDYSTDVTISGVLPLVVDRNSNSGHELGRALGPQWVSRVDCRIEVCAEEVLMLTPDGALLVFPPAPLNGSEVMAQGRPWLLSFTDGVYRVRDAAAGVVYVFAVAGEHSTVQPVAPLADNYTAHDPADPVVPEDLTGMRVAGYGCPGSSIAGAAGMGIEVGLSAVIHRTGHSIAYSYDVSSGLMTKMRRSDGTIVEVVWDRQVRRVASLWLSHEDTPDEQPQRLISYEYDAHGRLRRVINSAAGALSYHYDEAGRVAGWTDRNGVSYRYVFDDAGRVVTQVGTGGMFPNAFVWLADDGADAPEGGTVCVMVEAAGEFAGDPLEVGDAVIPELLDRIEGLPLVRALRTGGLQAAGLTGAGRDGYRNHHEWKVPEEWLQDEVLGQLRPSVYRATVVGDVWRIVSPGGACVDYAHNQYHQVIEQINPDGGVVSTSFNTFGVVTGVVYPDDSETIIEPAAWGTPARVVGRDGLTTDYEVDPAGTITAVTSPEGLVTRCEYTWLASGLVDAGHISPAGVETRVECDGAGRMLATVDAAGRRWSVTRDAAGRVVESMNPVGDVTRVEYSPEGWPWLVTNADGTTVRATYDGEGNVIQTVNEIGAITRTSYTVFDKPETVTDAGGGTTRVVYNTQMEAIGVVNADGHRWEITRDRDGEVIGERDYNGRRTWYEYDAAGRWQQIADAADKPTTRWWDSMGRIVSEVASGGVETTWTYTPQGRLASVANDAAVVSYAWDDYGRLVSESTQLASGEIVGISPVRDGFGRVIGQEIATPTGRVVRQVCGVDAATGEATDVVVSDQCGELVHCGLSVDAAGRRSQVVVGLVVRQWGFDTRGRVVKDVLGYFGDAATTATAGNAAGAGAGGVSVVAGRSWGWRGDNTVSVVNDVLAGVARFEVDVLGRVTGVHRDAAAEPTTTAAGVNAAGEIPRGVEEYAYSAAGVLMGVTAPGVDAYAPGVAKSRRVAEYGPAVEATTVELEGTKPIRVGRTTYTYDKLGRVVETVTRRLSAKPVVKRFAYRGSTGQVSGVWSSDMPGCRWVYAYDGLGRRVSKTCVDVVTNAVVSRVVFVHAGDVLTGQWTTVDDVGAGVPGVVSSAGVNTTGGVVGRVWVYDPDTGGLLGQIDYTHTTTGGVEAEFYAVVTDLAGAPRELVDPDTGTVVGRAIQSVFGRRRWEGMVSSPLLFAGQYEDTESGWVYNRNRFYDPVSGVYGAQDPLGVGPNLGTAQGYVVNPLTWVDPLGLKSYPTQATFDRPFRGDKFGRLGTKGPNNEWYERHHLISSYALRKTDLSTRYSGTAIQMTAADHAATRSYGYSDRAIAHRELEVQMIREDRVRELFSSEIQDIQAKFGDKYDDALYEAWLQSADEGVLALS